MSPRPGETRFAHAARPVEHGGLVELWHARLARRRADGRLVEPAADLDVLATDEVKDPDPVVDQQWLHRVRDTTIRNALDRPVRTALVTATGDSTPAVADRVTVSALGAWLDVRADLAAVSWEHKLGMGRDEQVRTVQEGILYPLGHRAIKVQTTRRVLESRSGRPARLVTTERLVVRDRTADYTKKGDDIERGWPWATVRLLASATPDGVGQAFVPAVTGPTLHTVDGAPYEFGCEGVDRGGRVSTFELPLVFVPAPFTALAAVEAEYGRRSAAFRTIEMRGQAVAVAAPTAAAPDATTVVAGSMRLGTVSRFDPARAAAARPLVEQIVGRLPSLDRFTATAAGELTVGYAGAYLKHAFGAGNAGEALLALAPDAARPVLDLADGALTGGLLTPRFDVVGLSRRLGPVGGDLAKLAATGTFSPADLLRDLAGELRLFGVFALQEILGLKNLPLDKAPRLLTQAVDGVTRPSFFWRVDLFNDTGAFQGVRPKVSVGAASGMVRRRRNPAKPTEELTAQLTLTVDTSLDVATATMRQHSRCEITNIELVLGLSGTDLVTVPIESITFDSVDGKKPDMDVRLGRIEFGGILSFIKALADLLPVDGFSDPPALDVRPDGVTSTFELPVPAVAVGMFSLENIVIASRLDLFFAGAAPTFAIGFARRESPFVLTVAALGGGGFVSVLLSTDGLRSLEGSLEFGAALTVSLGPVARGSVSAMGGLYFKVEDVDGRMEATLTAYLRIRGELRVLGLVSVSVELMLALTYQPATGKVSGRAELAVRVKVLFFKKTVKIEFERTFAGSNADPTFAELMAVPGDTGARAWDDYCLAFAAEEAA
jgi:hypothetical protein